MSLDNNETIELEQCFDLHSPKFESFSFIVNVVFDGTLCVIGLFCNILAFVVIQRDKKKLSMSILLQGLAVADGLFLVYELLYTCLRSAYPTIGALRHVMVASPYIVTLVLPLGWLTQTCGIWSVTAVTVDRYAMIAMPLQARQWCTVRNARRAVVGIFLCSTIYNFPRFFYYYHVSFEGEDGCFVNDSRTTFVGHMDTHSSFWISYRTVYHVWITWILLFFIPFPLLVILNIRLIRVISQASKTQEVLTGRKLKRDYNVTLNLVVVVTVFLVCQTPDFISSVITREHLNVDKTFLQYFLCVKESLLIINASVNFTIYCLFYKRFRRLLKQLLCARILKSSNDEYETVSMHSVAKNSVRCKEKRAEESPH